MDKDIVLVLAGFVVGAMNAIAGGGMLIGFPVLVALGLPPLIANGTGNVVTSPGQLSSAIGYWRYLRRVPLRYALFLLPISIGAALGALTLRMTSQHDFARIVPALVLLGVGLFAIQPYLHFHLHRHVKGVRKSAWPMILLGLAMLPLSFYGGYFGAGYGFIMLGLLGFTNMPDTHMINAMKNVSAIFVSGISILCLFSAHIINWHFGLVMAIGSTIGGYCGARWAQKVSSHWLRVAIIAVGLIAVAYLAVHQY